METAGHGRTPPRTLPVPRAVADDSEPDVPGLPRRHGAAGAPAASPSAPLRARSPRSRGGVTASWKQVICYRSAPASGKGARDSLLKHQPPPPPGHQGQPGPLLPGSSSCECWLCRVGAGSVPGEGGSGRPWCQAGRECGPASRPLRGKRTENANVSVLRFAGRSPGAHGSSEHQGQSLSENRNLILSSQRSGLTAHSTQENQLGGGKRAA